MEKSKKIWLFFNKYFFVFLFVLLFSNFLFWAMISFDDEIGGDAAYYHYTAINMAEGRGYVFDGESNMTREPAYSFFIALNYKIFGINPNIIKIEQFFMLCVIVLIAYFLFSRIFNKKIAQVTILVIALYPIFFRFSCHLVSETLTMFFIFLFFYLFYILQKKESRYMFMFLGIVFSALVMTKSVFLFLAPILVFLIFFERSVIFKIKIIRSILFMIGFCILVCPWMVRNYINFEDPMLATRSGVILYGHAVKTNFDLNQSAKYILSSVGGEYLVRRFIDSSYNFNRHGLGTDAIVGLREKITNEFGKLSYDETDRHIKKEAVKLIEENPVKYFLWGMLEVNNLNSPIVYYERHFSIFHNQIYENTVLKTIIIVILRTLWFLFLFLTVYGMYLSIKKRKKNTYLLIIFIFYVNIIIFCLQGIPRFIAPLLPVYFVFAIFGICDLYKFKICKQKSSLL